MYCNAKIRPSKHNNSEIYFALTAMIYWAGLSRNHAYQIVSAVEFALKANAIIWTTSIKECNAKLINTRVATESVKVSLDEIIILDCLPSCATCENRYSCKTC